MTNISNKTDITSNINHKAYIVWFSNGLARWNYYDIKDEEIYNQYEILLRTDNINEAVSFAVDYNLKKL